VSCPKKLAVENDKKWEKEALELKNGACGSSVRFKQKKPEKKREIPWVLGVCEKLGVTLGN